MNTNPEMEIERVRRHTSAAQLQRIEQQLEQNIQFYATQPDQVIAARLQELDQEWSIERFLDTNASVLALSGAALGLAVHKKWLGLSLLVSGFLAQHALMGWCPPVPVFRRLGVRTRGEIDREKFALKALRGDFQNLTLPERRPDGRIGQSAFQSASL